MLYLIKSAGYNAESGYIDLLKIGYTADNLREKRFSTYQMHNPTYKVLNEIPEGTEIQERKLHYRFKDKKFEGYGREWFYYDEEIINYFKDLTLAEIDKLPDPPLSLNRIKEIAFDLLVKINKYKNNIDYVNYQLNEILELNLKTYNEVLEHLVLLEGNELINIVLNENSDSINPKTTLIERLRVLYKPPTCLPSREIIKRLKVAYKEFNITTKPKLSDLNNYFNIIETNNLSFYWIEEKKEGI